MRSIGMFCFLCLTGIGMLVAAVPSDWRADVPEPVIASEPGWVDFYYYTWALADSNIETLDSQVVFGDARGESGLNGADIAWMTAFTRYVQNAHPKVDDPMAALDAFYSRQRADGMIPHNLDARLYRVQRPLFALGEWFYYRHCADTVRLRRVLPVLDRFFQAVKEKKGSPEGPYRDTFQGNGMANRPRGPFLIDLTAQQALNALLISRMSRDAGLEDLHQSYSDEYNHLKRVINTIMWDPEDRFYADLRFNFEPFNRWSIASFWPMWAHVPDSARLQALISVLNDPMNFNTPHRVTTLGRQNDVFYTENGTYWLGAVFSTTNTMVIKGLAANGQDSLATEIANNHLLSMFFTWIRGGTIHDNYNQSTVGLPGGRTRDLYVGTGGITPVSTLFEHILGIRVNAPELTLYWRLQRTDTHGIRNLGWGNDWSHQTDLIATPEVDSSWSVSVSSNARFKLVISGAVDTTLSVEQGEDQRFRVQ